MIAFLLRTIGLIVFSAGFIALVGDGVRSIAADRIITTPLLELWRGFDAAAFENVQGWMQQSLSGALLGPLLSLVLGWPAFLVVGGTGILLMLLGRKRRPRVLAI